LQLEKLFFFYKINQILIMIEKKKFNTKIVWIFLWFHLKDPLLSFHSISIWIYYWLNKNWSLSLTIFRQGINFLSLNRILFPFKASEMNIYTDKRLICFRKEAILFNALRALIEKPISCEGHNTRYQEKAIDSWWNFLLIISKVLCMFCVYIPRFSWLCKLFYGSVDPE